MNRPPPEDRDHDAIGTVRDGDVPRWLETSASIGWRILVVVGVVAVIAIGIVRLRVVVIPLLLGLLIASMLAPPAAWLKDRGWPPLLATWAVLLATAIVLSSAGWLLIPRLVDGLSEVGDAVAEGYDDIREWLIDGPWNIDPSTVEDAESTLLDRARTIAETGFTSQAALVAEILTAVFLTLVVTFFYVKDGDAFHDHFVRRFPEDLRSRLDAALVSGWSVLQRYVVGVLVVGLADAILIGVGVAIVGVPLVLPIMALTFLAAFFPLVGAIFAGGVATLLALASGGIGDAAIVLLITIAVQQADGDVIAPLVYSRAVDLHPLAILLAITSGAILAGLMGAFLAVPILAVGVAMRSSWRESTPAT